MERTDAERLLKRQQDYFSTGKTLPVEARKAALRRLAAAIDTFEEKLGRRPSGRSGKKPVGKLHVRDRTVKSELSYMLRHVARFAREKTRSHPAGPVCVPEL